MPQPLCYSSLNTFRHPCLTTVTGEIYDRLITLRDFRHKLQLWRRAWKAEREGDGAEKIKTRKTARGGGGEGQEAGRGIDSDAGPGNNKVLGIKPNRLVSWGKKDLLCALIPTKRCVWFKAHLLCNICTTFYVLLTTPCPLWKNFHPSLVTEAVLTLMNYTKTPESPEHCKDNWTIDIF